MSTLSSKERLLKTFKGEPIDRIATFDILHNVDLIEHLTAEKIDPENAEADQIDLLFGQPPTKLQGTKMLGVRGLNLEREIGRFIELRLVKQPYPWYKRTSED